MVDPVEYQSIQTADLVRIDDSAQTFTQVINWMMMAPSKGYVCITSDVQRSFDVLKSCTRPIDAAGGVMFNKSGKLLMIKRLGYWDLPKGKVDPGETVDFTAIREVKEECGLKDFKIVKAIGKTYHIYNQYPDKMLKTCHWFSMECEDGIELTPQKEEHIEEAVWYDVSTIDLKTFNTYNTIRELLSQVLKK
ncbi:MAG: NUDIX domain-containing protein [Bacteroidetes bacterium]|nr:NUDIX domain-containing protein [Bacteroidota bacterium]